MRMPARKSHVSGVILAAALLALPACERGCAWKYLGKAGVGRPVAPGGAQGPGLAADEIDCPDGLARCVAGVVETSQLARRPRVCHGSTETCECPWTRSERCPSACIAESVVLSVGSGRAAAQLCAPAPAEPRFARPSASGMAPPPNEAERSRCDEGAAFVCEASRVIDCREGRVLGTCVGGCGPDPALDAVDGPALAALTSLDVLALLCAR